MEAPENTIEESAGCCKPKQSCNTKTILIILVIISILTNIWSAYYVSQATSDAVIEKYLALEYKKSGSKSNYELLAQAQSLQLAQQMDQIKQFVESQKPKTESGSTEETKADTAAANKNVSQDEIAAVKKGAYIEGNKDAKITLVEYSDLECPYCIRQYREGTIKKLHEKYGDKINSTFKNFRGVPHENSEAEANALLCVGEIGGLSKYVSFYNKVFERTNGGNGTGFSKDDLLPLAKEISVDTKKMKSCIDSKRNIARFDAETTEGKKFGVQGTPGTVVINNETGAYELINGAYPVDEFERVIDKLMGAK